MAELYVGGTLTSLTDWEGYVSYVIFYAGCNLRCQYCHNPDLILQRNGEGKTVSHLLEDIRNSRLIDAVIHTGGEPTEQNPFYLQSLIQALYNDDISQKLDTNGTSYGIVKKIIYFLDKISLDLKAPPVRFRKLDNYLEPGMYDIVTGVDCSQKIIDIDRTLKLGDTTEVKIEGRTTIVPNLIYTEQHIRDILEWAVPYIDEYTLQVFRNEVVLNPVLRAISPPTREHMEMLADVAKEYLPNVNIRPHAS